MSNALKLMLIFICTLPYSLEALAICRIESEIPATTPSSDLVDNANGTVTDNRTGLMWKQCTEGLSGSDCGTETAAPFSWRDALQLSESLNVAGGYAGYTDWRLPNINELMSLVEAQCSYPAINPERFPNTPSLGFWSSSPSAGYSNYAWYVFFKYGHANYGDRSGNLHVRLVRSGQ